MHDSASLLRSRKITPPPAGSGEAAWREIYYSHVGEFTQCVLEPGAPWWLAAMHHRPPRAPEELDRAWLEGKNTYLLCSPSRLAERWEEIERALASDDRGTRVTILLPAGFPAGEKAWASALARLACRDEISTRWASPRATRW